MSQQTVLITGASAGIGSDFARLYARRGDALVLVARRTDKLEALAQSLRDEHGVTVHVLTQDLAQVGAAAQLVEQLDGAGLEVDVLVNNAGFGLRGNVVELDNQRQAEMIQLNCTALTELCRLLLPGMQARGRGGILNVGSTAGFQPGPHMAVYYASKAYVLMFSEALHEECRGSGVHVSCLCPGATATEFADVANMNDSLLFRMGTMTSAKVAAIGVAGLDANRAVVIAGLKNWLGAFSLRFTPRFVVRWLVKFLQ